MPAAQPRASIAETFDRMTPEWDELVRCAGLMRSPRDLHDVEERAQRFADNLVAAVRGATARRPSAEPLLITEHGAWFG